ncbi:hypothetical protein [Streptomyces luteireticuli]|uniref:hypothetical protein n=1 Tax=Streptomyces luteireticuli TaxID=173858 RepID=UPI0035577235
MIPATVHAAYYGLGAIFPMVILDAFPRWRRPQPGALPDRTHGGEELLAVRWCGPDTELATAPDLLTKAAAAAPAAPPSPAELEGFRQSLPEHLRLTAIRASAVIGPWDTRPGASRPAKDTRGHRAAA